MKMRVYLKGGGELVIPVTNFTVEKNKFSGAITALNWTYPKNGRAGLLHLNLNEVAAIVREGR